IAASVMGVAAVGLVAATLYKQDAPAPQLVAGSPAVKVVSTTAPVRPVGQPGSGDAMREYVFAHQGLSRGGPLPAGVQYVRTVSDQRQGNDRCGFSQQCWGFAPCWRKALPMPNSLPTPCPGLAEFHPPGNGSTTLALSSISRVIMSRRPALRTAWMQAGSMSGSRCSMAARAKSSAVV